MPAPPCDSCRRRARHAPLLGPFVTGMLRLGRAPERVVRLIATGWPLVYRNMRAPRYERNSAGTPILYFEQIPPIVRKYRNYQHCWHGVCQAFAQLAGVEGRVRFEIASHGSSESAHFSWC